uniref:Tubulin--tyrosine ligase-like protein 9 n=1 Tax=Tetraselmis chuii TaxID=63592 RepID=A0A7S1SNS3_9CHLO
MEAEAAAAADFLTSSEQSVRWALFLDNPWFKSAAAAQPVRNPDGTLAQAHDGGVVSLLESCFPQTHINGARNVWIAKPGGKSRGRGIALFNDLPALLQYCTPLKGEKWLVQKYIERPLLIMRRKFDLRQWALVSDWNPLTVWFYGECYLRFTADDFDLGDLDIFAHLSNNSVSKYAQRGRTDEITLAGNMWSVARFKQHLLESYGTELVWGEEIVPQMKAIVRQTLTAAQGEVKPRKNTCQLYGYDFMIDDNYKVWLLEINSSPTMEPSTEIAARLCAEVQEDIVKVVVDLPDALTALKAAGDPPPPDATPADLGVDTGKWECILRTQPWVTPGSYMGVSLSCQGILFKGMQPKKATKSPKSKPPANSNNSSPYEPPIKRSTIQTSTESVAPLLSSESPPAVAGTTGNSSEGGSDGGAEINEDK